MWRACVILNAGGLGMGMTNPSPSPVRSCIRACCFWALDWLRTGVSLAAGIAGALGFLIHPTTMAPFWGVAVAVVVLRRAARPILLAPLLPAAGVLFLLMHFQTGGTEPLDFFRSVDSFQ